MRFKTREKLNREWVQGVAMRNFVTDVTSTFTVDPAVQQRMYTKVQESADFLKLINVMPVKEQSGEKLQLGVDPETVASRTDTSVGDREAVDPAALSSQEYHCEQTNFDTAISYGKVDMLANHHDFAVRMRNTIVNRKALDLIMMGFNGTHAAADTDREANPLLQDVNIGWLEHIRTQCPDRAISEVLNDTLQVTVGEDGDYKNVDALVWDAYSIIPNELKGAFEEYAVIMSRHLISDRSSKMYEAASDEPSKLEAAQLAASNKKIAGLKVIAAPYMPRKSILITPLSNLSIYYQEGKDRRRIVNNSKRDQVENYESSNVAFVVEDFEKVVLVENITLLDRSDWHDDSAYVV